MLKIDIAEGEGFTIYTSDGEVHVKFDSIRRTAKRARVHIEAPKTINIVRDTAKVKHVKNNEGCSSEKADCGDCSKD